jgi:Phytanoyl-CoA dioxygenase (PhyH)
MKFVRAKKMILSARAFWRLLTGLWQFSRRRATPGSAYQSLIYLFCQTGGWSNDLLARAIALKHPSYRWEEIDGILGKLSPQIITDISNDIKENGFHIFEKTLPREVCNRLQAFALSREAIIRPMDNQADPARKEVYNPSSPKGIIYDFDPDMLVNDPDIQSLVTDTALISVVQNYIGSKPVLDEVNLWWSTAYGAKADDSAAQLYHFDMDRIRWLKVFFYITDVGPDNGPHCFVIGSHKTKGIPSSLLDRGYARISDEEVRTKYGQERLIAFTAPRGTIIAEDTRGLHKGLPVLRGHRLILEFEFSNSLFGGTPLKVSRFRTFHSSEVEHFVRSHSRMYERWLDR